MVRHLLKGCLEVNPEKRLTTSQILKHPWVRDQRGVQSNGMPSFEVFTDQERNSMVRDFSCADTRRLNRNS